MARCRSVRAPGDGAPLGFATAQIPR
jgi:hypothetical protein